MRFNDPVARTPSRMENRLETTAVKRLEGSTAWRSARRNSKVTPGWPLANVFDNESGQLHARGHSAVAWVTKTPPK